jgi:hypothetical protein
VTTNAPLDSTFDHQQVDSNPDFRLSQGENHLKAGEEQEKKWESPLIDLEKQMTTRCSVYGFDSGTRHRFGIVIGE